MSDMPASLADPPPDELDAIREALEADGVRLCDKCGVRPVKEKISKKGPQPTKCEVCAPVDPRMRPGTGPKEQWSPGSVHINLGGPTKTGGARGASKKDRDAAIVEAKAKQMAQMVVVILTMVQQTGDAAIVSQGGDNWAKAVGGLGPYEPWLVKLCEGGETAGRAMAWLTAILATLGIAVPVLIHHNLLPEGPLQAAFAGIAATAQAA